MLPVHQCLRRNRWRGSRRDPHVRRAVLHHHNRHGFLVRGLTLILKESSLTPAKQARDPYFTNAAAELRRALEQCEVIDRSVFGLQRAHVIRTADAETRSRT